MELDALDKTRAASGGDVKANDLVKVDVIERPKIKFELKKINWKINWPGRHQRFGDPAQAGRIARC